MLSHPVHELPILHVLLDLLGVWLRFTLIIRLSQPSLAEVGAGAELGNSNIMASLSYG